MVNESLDLWEHPVSENMYMLVGWRQWADAGSMSSGLPRYLVKQTTARQIGQIRSEGFYLFQVPGTHDLVRPVVKFSEGLAESMRTPSNEFYYAGNEQQGVIIFIGDEPHMNVEQYSETFLEAAKQLGVKRIVGFGGIYAEVPHNKERLVSSIYSLGRLKDEVEGLAVNLSDYQGGASIGSYICKRAGEQEVEYVSFYTFVPTYDLSGISQIGNSIRIENDYIAWLNVMQRVNYMLKLSFDLADLEAKGERLIKVVDAKIEELENVSPQLGIRDYIDQVAEAFTEVPFQPLDDVWEQEFRRLFDGGDVED
ncbi:MAG TPA: PAC2 family protein [candidate division Zixibacteria bacterium]|nr:PAC2 family protein [candidate division Zixibacteria bacterium]